MMTHNSSKKPLVLSMLKYAYPDKRPSTFVSAIAPTAQDCSYVAEVENP